MPQLSVTNEVCCEVRFLAPIRRSQAATLSSATVLLMISRPSRARMVGPARSMIRVPRPMESETLGPIWSPIPNERRLHPTPIWNRLTM
jgi:hypothetical protein